MISFYQLNKIIVHWEEGPSFEELPPSDWPMSTCVEHFLN